MLDNEGKIRGVFGRMRWDLSGSVADWVIIPILFQVVYILIHMFCFFEIRDRLQCWPLQANRCPPLLLCVDKELQGLNTHRISNAWVGRGGGRRVLVSTDGRIGGIGLKGGKGNGIYIS